MLAKKTFFIKRGSQKQKVIANILDFPSLIQPNLYSCGVVCVENILWYYGDWKRQEHVLEDVLKMNEDGIEVKNIIQFFRKGKFIVDARQMTLTDIEFYLKKGVPVIVLLQARTLGKKKIDYDKTWQEGHYVVVVGYHKNYLFFADPVTCHTCYLPKKEFIYRWHDQDSKEKKYINYGIAVYGKTSKYDSQELRKIN